MKIIYLSVFTGKKLSRSFSEKEIVVGEEALRNESKVVKRRLGLWVKFSIIVARHPTDLRREKKNDRTMEEASWSQDFC